MKINLNVCDTSAQAVTKICYNEATRNLSYRIECNDLKDLKECVKIIDGYNAFDWRIVNKALDKYADAKVYYSEGNPNNGKDLFEFEIGREGSPVMYIKMRSFFGVNKVSINDCPVEYTKEMFENDMKNLASFASADEHTLEDSGFQLEYRIWWD